MKLTKLLLTAAVAGAMAFVSGKAVAKGVALNIKGVLSYQSTAAMYTGTTAKYKFNNKVIYQLLTTAVGNVYEDYGPYIDDETLPSDGYIAFDPEGYDGEVYGTFYVTNSSGYYYPLSGYDQGGLGYYYSFIEADTYFVGADEFGVGWSDPFDGVSKYNINTTTISGSQTSMSEAVLYIHDNPYSYDVADKPEHIFYNYNWPYDDNHYNYNAIEIRGVATLKFSFKDAAVSKGAVSLKGSGNAIYEDNTEAVVTKGSAKYSEK